MSHPLTNTPLHAVEYHRLPADTYYYRSPNGGVEYHKSAIEDCEQRIVYVY